MFKVDIQCTDILNFKDYFEHNCFFNFW